MSIHHLKLNKEKLPKKQRKKCNDTPIYITPLVDTKAKQWISLPGVRWENNKLFYPKHIAIEETFKTLYNSIIAQAMPSLTYPAYHSKVLGLISDHSVKVPRKWVSLIKAASICLYYQPSDKNIRRPEGFKRLPIEPFLSNLFYRASTQRDDALLYCFMFTVQHWVDFLLKNNRQGRRHLMTPAHPCFHLYYSLPILLERLSDDFLGSDNCYVVQNFLLFSSVQVLTKRAASLLLHLYSLYKMINDMINTNSSTWVCDVCTYEDAKDLCTLFNRYPLVRSFCEANNSFGVYKDGALEIKDDETRLALYQFAFDPLLETSAAEGLLQGLRRVTEEPISLPPTRTRRLYPTPTLPKDLLYDDHCIFSNLIEQPPQYNPYPLETFLGFLETEHSSIRFLQCQNHQPMTGKLQPLALTKFFNRSAICFSSQVILPIFVDAKGLILNTEEVFFLTLSKKIKD